MLKRLHLWAILFSCLPALILAQAPRNDRLTLDLYLELESVADPQLSPDGSQIIYTRGGVDKVNDKRETSLWIMNADGGRNRFLADGSSARWSPNGDRIIYSAQGKPKGTQIFVRWMDAEGATSQMTSTPSNFLRTQLYLRYWFDKYKRGGTKTTTTSGQDR